MLKCKDGYAVIVEEGLLSTRSVADHHPESVRRRERIKQVCLNRIVG